jgi:hypothetical protein
MKSNLMKFVGMKGIFARLTSSSQWPIVFKGISEFVVQWFTSNSPCALLTIAWASSMFSAFVSACLLLLLLSLSLLLGAALVSGVIVQLAFKVKSRTSPESHTQFMSTLVQELKNAITEHAKSPS